MKFRTDIHGLRGVSVLLVIFYHFGLPGFGGGFIGVDIFFVISGFLITRLIWKELQAQTFTLSGFYLRRVKRILPAALITLLVFGFLGAILFPVRAEQFGKEILYAVPALSNFFYSGQSGYFALQAEEFLFLNTWSLAVEEQFYLLWPLLLLVLFKTSKKHVGAFSIFILITSFIGASFLWHYMPTTGFYHLPGRAWELALGAVIGIYAGTKLTFGPRTRTVFQLFGVGLIALFLVLAENTVLNVSPILLALPVGGAGLMIAFGAQNKSITAAVLNSAPLQFLGGISYSLYLIHWPLMVLLIKYLGRPPVFWEAALAIFVSIVLAWLSLRFVENPFRYKKWKARQLVGTAAFGTVLVLLSGTFLNTGLFGKTFRNIEQIDTTKKLATDLPDGCNALPRQMWPGQETCRIGATDVADTSFWLIGDSHAHHFEPGITALAKRRGISGVFYSSTSSLPIAGLQQYKNKAVFEHAEIFRRQVFAELEQAQPSTVILAARWSVYYDTEQFLRPNKARWFSKLKDTDTLDVPTTRTAMETALIETITALQSQHHRVVLLGQIPEYGQSQLDCAAKALSAGTDVNSCGPAHDLVMARLAPSHEMLKRVSAKTGATLILPHEKLCDEEDCQMVLGNTYIYRDSNHMNAQGSRLVVDAIATELLATMELKAD